MGGAKWFKRSSVAFLIDAFNEHHNIHERSLYSWGGHVYRPEPTADAGPARHQPVKPVSFSLFLQLKEAPPPSLALSAFCTYITLEVPLNSHQGPSGTVVCFSWCRRVYPTGVGGVQWEGLECNRGRDSCQTRTMKKRTKGSRTPRRGAFRIGCDCQLRFHMRPHSPRSTRGVATEKGPGAPQQPAVDLRLLNAGQNSFRGLGGGGWGTIKNSYKY